MAIFLSSYNIFNYLAMHKTDCKRIFSSDKNKDLSMKQLWFKDPKTKEDYEILDHVKECLEMNSFLALTTCIGSLFWVFLIAWNVTLDPIDAGLIIHEKAFNLSSNMTQKIRKIMSIG